MSSLAGGRGLFMPRCLFSELFFVRACRLSNLKLVGHATTTDNQSRESNCGSDTVVRSADSGSGGGGRQAWLGPCRRRVELRTVLVVRGKPSLSFDEIRNSKIEGGVRQTGRLLF